MVNFSILFMNDTAFVGFHKVATNFVISCCILCYSSIQPIEYYFIKYYRTSKRFNYYKLLIIVKIKFNNLCKYV